MRPFVSFFLLVLFAFFFLSFFSFLFFSTIYFETNFNDVSLLLFNYYYTSIIAAEAVCFLKILMQSVAYIIILCNCWRDDVDRSV